MNIEKQRKRISVLQCHEVWSIELNEKRIIGEIDLKNTAAIKLRHKVHCFANGPVIH